MSITVLKWTKNQFGQWKSQQGYRIRTSCIRGKFHHTAWGPRRNGNREHIGSGGNMQALKNLCQQHYDATLTRTLANTPITLAN